MKCFDCPYRLECVVLGQTPPPLAFNNYEVCHTFHLNSRRGWFHIASTPSGFNPFLEEYKEGQQQNE